MRFKDSVLDALGVIQANQETIIGLLKAAATQENRMKADLSDVLKAVEEQKTVDDSIEALVDGLATKLEGMSTDGTVAPADLAALASSIRANNAQIQAKVTANTPAAPPVVLNPPPPPPPAGV